MHETRPIHTQRMTNHLCVLHLATAGLNGALLGSDEEEIVFVSLVVINSVNNQVRFFQVEYV